MFEFSRNGGVQVETPLSGSGRQKAGTLRHHHFGGHGVHAIESAKKIRSPVVLEAYVDITRALDPRPGRPLRIRKSSCYRQAARSTYG